MPDVVTFDPGSTELEWRAKESYCYSTVRGDSGALLGGSVFRELSRNPFIHAVWIFRRRAGRR
jgi:hypothetical protein